MSAAAGMTRAVMAFIGGCILSVCSAPFVAKEVSARGLKNSPYALRSEESVYRVQGTGGEG